MSLSHYKQDKNTQELENPIFHKKKLKLFLLHCLHRVHIGSGMWHFKIITKKMYFIIYLRPYQI